MEPDCYAFAFDIVRYSDREFYDKDSSEPYAAQPGVFSGTKISDNDWCRQNPDGSWSHKMAWLDAENLGFIDPVEHADSICYERTVGYFYVKKGNESDKE